MSRILRNLVKRLLPRSLHPVRFQLARKARASRRRQALLGPYATAVLTEGDSGKLLVAASDMEVGRYLAFHGGYNRSEIEFYLRQLTPDSQVLFVGAHVGSLLVPIARQVRHVVGIEANPRTFALLEMNVRLNDLHNVELHQFAAGDREGEIEFLMHQQNTGTSLIKHGKVDEHDPVWGYDSPELVRVPMRRLDDSIGARSFDLIIMDVEGAEYLALKGMPRLLEHARRLCVEVVPHFTRQVAAVEPDEVVALLAPYFEQAWTVEDALKGIPGTPPSAFANAAVWTGPGIDLYFESTCSLKPKSEAFVPQ